MRTSALLSQKSRSHFASDFMASWFVEFHARFISHKQCLRGELCLGKFKKNTSNIDLHSDTYKAILFKLWW